MPRRYGSRSRVTTTSRPSAGVKITVSARMTDEVHAKAVAMAEDLDISLSALLAELVERAEVDSLGRPTWDSKYAPRDHTDQELPLTG